MAILDKLLSVFRLKTRWYACFFFALILFSADRVNGLPVNLKLQNAGDSITLEQVINGKWERYSETSLEDRYTTLWAKFTFVPKSTTTIIELTGYLNEFTIYINYNNDGWQALKSENVHSVARPMISKFRASIVTKPFVVTTVYIKTKTRYVKPDYRYFTGDEYAYEKLQETIIISVIVGFLICIVVISIFYFLIERNLLYIYYSFFVFFLSLPSLGGIFFSPAFVTIDEDFIISVLTNVSNLLVGVFGILFAYFFLELKRFQTLRKFLIFYLLLVLAGYFVNTFLLINMGPLLHILSITLLWISIAVGFHVWRKGSPYAVFFSVAYLLFSIFYSLKLASTYGLIPFNGFYFLFGTTSEALILAYALGSKVMYEKNENKRLLQTTNEELAKQNTQLEQYSHMVAHNLRAPVARLLGLARVLKQSKDETLKSELVDKMERTAIDFDAILREISLMLEVKKGVRFEMEPVLLKESILQAVSFLEEDIKETNTTIKVDVADTLFIKGMKPYLKSIFLNLISNAIKYRDVQRAPSINIVSYKNGSQAIIIISDNGLGIDLSLHGAKVFEPFKRFHTHREGRGLGLHLVKVEVEAMKGSITLESELGKGTTFIISLLLAN